MAPMLTTLDALAFLGERYGIRRSPRSWARYVAAGTAPVCHRLGRYRFYEPTELDAWVRSQLRKGNHHEAERVRPRR
jgi:hypothetical protein